VTRDKGGKGGSLKRYVTLSNFQPKHKQSMCMPLADTPVPVIDMDVHLSSPWGNTTFSLLGANFLTILDKGITTDN